MLLFRSEEHVKRWCRQWNQPRGAQLSLAQGWGLAKGWYSDRLEKDWHPKAPQEATALFKELGLTSRFWRFS